MVALLFLILISSLSYAQSITTPGYKQSIPLSAIYPASGNGVTLNWPLDSTGTGLTVSRKARSAAAWTTLASLPDTSVLFRDSTLIPGTVMEYQVVRVSSTGNAWGYLLAGNGKQVAADKGQVALVVEDRIDTLLSDVVLRLHTDLIGDGWRVKKLRAKSGDSVAVIRRYLTQLHQTDSSLNTVFLLGGVPVPYSGNQNPDGHADHLGAWPADVYYGELTSTWADQTVNSTTASRTQNRNVPGDGKFDLSSLPSSLELAVGRVDFTRMSQFGAGDTALIRRYLNKDHEFRHGRVTAAERALVDDNFTGMAEGFSQGAWRGFPALVPLDSVKTGDFLTLTGGGSYLLAYGCGGGSYTSCGGVASTADFVSRTVSVVLTPLFGSYFGDFDSDNNLLRAAIAANGLTLATIWSGRPNIFFHTLGLGETFGEMAKLSQSNTSLYQVAGYGANRVHTALMGDPTLTLYPFPPPSNLALSRLNGNQVKMDWRLSPDSAVRGYRVERADSISGAWTLLSASLVSGATFTDPAAPSRSVVYRIRAQKLKRTPSGSFWQTSQGVMDSIGPATAVEKTGRTSLMSLAALSQPFGNLLILRLNLPAGRNVLRIVNVRGRLAWRADFRQGPGSRVLTIDTRAWGRGLYFACLAGDAGRKNAVLIAQ